MLYIGHLRLIAAELTQLDVRSATQLGVRAVGAAVTVRPHWSASKQSITMSERADRGLTARPPTRGDPVEGKDHPLANPIGPRWTPQALCLLSGASTAHQKLR